jgi:ribosomal protein S18 acetylase RimI-like enzyme
MHIRKATPDDVDVLVDVLVRAFEDDPPMRYVLRGGAHREKSFRAFFRHALTRLTLPHEEVYTDEARTGVALWAPPGKWKQRWHEHLRDFFTWGQTIGWSRLPEVLEATKGVVAAHPSEPHYYLLAIGVDPSVQGRGLGRALMAPVLERCDREKVPAYLEASKLSNVPWYERAGFVLQKELSFGEGKPSLFAMWRKPQA